MNYIKSVQEALANGWAQTAGIRNDLLGKMPSGSVIKKIVIGAAATATAAGIAYVARETLAKKEQESAKSADSLFGRVVRQVIGFIQHVSELYNQYMSKAAPKNPGSASEAASAVSSTKASPKTITLTCSGTDAGIGEIVKKRLEEMGYHINTSGEGPARVEFNVGNPASIKVDGKVVARYDQNVQGTQHLEGSPLLYGRVDESVKRALADVIIAELRKANNQ